jgi:hypothetical protein
MAGVRLDLTEHNKFGYYKEGMESGMNDCDQLPFNSKVLQEKSRLFRFWLDELHQPTDEADLSARSSGGTLPFLLFVHTSLQHFSPQLLFIYCFSCTTQSPSAHS